MNRILKTTQMTAIAIAMLVSFNVSANNGILIEAYGSYGIGQAAGTDWVQKDNITGAAESTTSFYTYAEQKGKSGIGFGVNFGYDVVANVAAVLGYSFQSLSAENVKGGRNNASTRIDTTKTTITTHFVNLGIRPSVAALAGTIYGGGGLLMGIPSSTIEQSSTQTGNDYIIKTGLNLAFGYYGEVGYQYKITDAISVGLGLQINVLSSSNKGKDSSSVSGTGAGTTTQVKYSDTPGSATCPANTNCSGPTTYDLTSTQFKLTVGYKL